MDFIEKYPVLNNEVRGINVGERLLVSEKPITINAYDIDAMGIVSNIVYIRWFEDLRMEFLKEYYPIDEMLKIKISPILMKTEVEYKAPLTIFDKPIGKCWLTHTGGTSWTVEFEISTDNEIHCLGKQSGCFFDLEKKRVTRIPAPLANLLDMNSKENE